MNKDKLIAKSLGTDRNITAPVQRAPRIGVPSGQELAWNGATDLTKTTIMCHSCKVPLYTVYTPIPISYYKDGNIKATKTKDPIAHGPWKIPRTAQQPCPRCAQPFTFLDKTGKVFRYLTDKGIM